METRNAIRTVITISYKIIILALIVILIYYAGGAAYRFGIAIFNESAVDTPANARTVTVTIPENPSVKQVAQVLDDNNLADGKLFYIQAYLSNYKKYFVGGQFELKSSMTPTEIMVALTEESRAKALEAETSTEKE